MIGVGLILGGFYILWTTVRELIAVYQPTLPVVSTQPDDESDEWYAWMPPLKDR